MRSLIKHLKTKQNSIRKWGTWIWHELMRLVSWLENIPKIMAAEKNPISNPYSFAMFWIPSDLSTSGCIFKSQGCSNSNAPKTVQKTEKTSTQTMPNNLQMPSCKSSLSYLLPSNPRQGSNQCIRGSTGPPGPLGPEGGAGGPVGPKRFTNSGGIWVPGESGRRVFRAGFFGHKTTTNI